MKYEALKHVIVDSVSHQTGDVIETTSNVDALVIKGFLKALVDVKEVAEPAVELEDRAEAPKRTRKAK